MKTKKNKIVFIQGTFDILKWSHIKTFEFARSFGDKLIVALNTDKLVSSYTHQMPHNTYPQRKFIVESIKYVDLVVPAPHFSPMELLKKYNPDVYCIGSGWTDSKKEEIAYMKSQKKEVRIVPEFK